MRRYRRTARPCLAPDPAAVPADTLGTDEFAPLPGGVAWPTVEATTAGEVSEVPVDVRYTVEVTGLKPLGLEDEFRSLSALWTKRNDEANIAQINRRIVEDKDLIDQLLRSVGHYGGDSKVVVTPPVRAGQPTRGGHHGRSRAAVHLFGHHRGGARRCQRA